MGDFNVFALMLAGLPGIVALIFYLRMKYITSLGVTNARMIETLMETTKFQERRIAKLLDENRVLKEDNRKLHDTISDYNSKWEKFSKVFGVGDQ